MKLLVIAAMLLVAGCSASPPAGSPAPAASSTDLERGWGPLAILPPDDGSDTAAMGGVLRITDACVSLETPIGEQLLFWDGHQVTWDDTARAIIFVNDPWANDGRAVTLRDGDQIVVGGSGGGGEDSGESIEAFIARLPWVSTPSSTCGIDRWWSVGAVEITGS